jgi:hypothetical protein
MLAETRAWFDDTDAIDEDVDLGHGAEPAPDLEARERGAEQPMPKD